ncbi:hypothetical protein DID80_03430 [Candidatus Marinamargulisbacteria bacterium SCGC AAA071-K20]|nr:hypothetical protein DID80_03430 [Candidatus Marinamargulisbacteria bacterium SCGC AAA071-K20]
MNTIVSRSLAPTEIGSIVGVLYASTGYIVIVPDYLGYRVSEIPHPYLHKSSLTSILIEAIRSTKQLLSILDITTNNQLFLTGYSEGGYATIAATQEIEKNLSEEISMTIYYWFSFQELGLLWLQPMVKWDINIAQYALVYTIPLFFFTLVSLENRRKILLKFKALSFILCRPMFIYT